MPAQWQQAGGDPPDRTLEVYKVAVEEYRFQADYNWRRTQYLLAFNAAILAAGSSIGAKGNGAALVFLLGAVAAVVSIQVTRQQHDYYRAARDRMQRLEHALELPDDQRTDTTSTLGGRRRLASVTQLITGLFSALAVSHVVGIVAVLEM